MNEQGKAPTKDELLQLVDSGKTTQEIADMYGVTYQSIAYWMRRQNIDRHYTAHTAPPLHEVQDMTSRFSYPVVAEYYGVKEHAVGSWVKYYGLRDYKSKTRKNGLPPEAREYALKNYFLGLWDVADIVEEYVCDPRAVEADIREHGKTEDTVHLMPTRKEFLEDSKTRSVTELAEWYGTTESQVLRWYKAHGIKKQGAKQ